MEKGFLDKVEDNATVRTWSETTQQEKGDSLADGHVSKLWDFTRISVEKHLFCALAQFWNPAYCCFTFGKVDFVPTIEEYWVAARIKQKGDSKCVPWRSLKDAILTYPDVRKRRITPILAILAETFRSLSTCRKAGEGRFIGCAQLLLAWFHSHFWKVDKVSYRVFFENYSPLKEIVATPRRDDISEEKWMVIL
ncbi:hypothetical protein Gotur_025535 [Gossypium turneri]